MGDHYFLLETGLQAVADRLHERHRIPVSTYRLQMNSSFRFDDARQAVRYLAALGITDCYSSPLMAAAPGSLHGYDICDPGRLNPDLGGEADFDAFARELSDNRMGLVLDFVPNHMGLDPKRNPWWRDVLQNGTGSPYARFFDIDWDPVKAELKGKILLPILDDQYGIVLERGDLRLALDDSGFVVLYRETSLPVNPRQWVRVLGHRIEALKQRLQEADPSLQEFLSILTELQNLPGAGETDPARVAEREREQQVARGRLKRLIEISAEVREHVERNIGEFNGAPGDPASFDLLHGLLETLPYRLSYWKTASHEINYRRFFDISSLGGLRAEEDQVFAMTHQLLFRLIAERKITGLRLDHIDGLFDPANYLEKLQEEVLQRLANEVVTWDDNFRDEWRDTVHAWRQADQRHDPDSETVRPFYVVVEKVLSGGEQLPKGWAVYGTTGYDFLNDLNGLFIDPRGAGRLRRAYERFVGRRPVFSDVVYDSKRLIMTTSMASELNVLAHELNRLSEEDRRSRDFTLNSLRHALREIVACFPVYRTYVNASGWTDADRQAIERAVARARRRNPAAEPSIFDFIMSVLLPPSGLPERAYRRRLRFAMKFQQYTGPVMAKGHEDTALYRYNCLPSANEVGGDPLRMSRTLEEFHESNGRRAADWPCGLLATSTHDAKRGEDVRARLNVLSEMPQEWAARASAWARINARHRSTVDSEPAPDAEDEYLFYQTLLGCWPNDPRPDMAALTQRLRAYMIKAIREAKRHTSWVNVNQAYEEAVLQFVDKSLNGPGSAEFLAALEPLRRKVALYGALNGLSQTVLKIASPGVPDFYQGSELWDLSLVDPDNRRPVDFQRMRRMLERIEALEAQPETAARELLARWEDGGVKMYAIRKGLQLRRAHPRLFLRGDYLPLEASGARKKNVCAFARRLEAHWVIAAAPRWLTKLNRDDTLPLERCAWTGSGLRLPDEAPAAWVNVLTGQPVVSSGGTLPLAGLFASFPVALLKGA